LVSVLLREYTTHVLMEVLFSLDYYTTLYRRKRLQDIKFNVPFIGWLLVSETWGKVTE